MEGEGPVPRHDHFPQVLVRLKSRGAPDSESNIDSLLYLYEPPSEQGPIVQSIIDVTGPYMGP